MSRWLIVLFLLTGCAHYNVSVDALNSGAEVGKTYVLLSAKDGVKGDDLQFKEYAGMVDTALEAQGFRHAPDLSEADQLIMVDYGIGAPCEKLFSYSLPVWGQTGYSGGMISGTVSPMGTFNGTATLYPQYGVTGYTTHVGSYTTYGRYWTVCAFDAAEYRRSGKVTELWRTIATSTGRSADLRRVMPAMVNAAKPYLSGATKQQVYVTVYDSDL